ncbi:MAG: dTDP-4-dehydrorhamnose reductase [bacterium]|nr:dTDP-4-dehydrorhamnose reductase [bacterium]
MKTLIIGAKGMLGQDLAKVFSEEELTLWDREDIDITDKEVVYNKITELQPELILNAAAYNDVDGAEKNEEIAMQVNAHGPGNIAGTAKKINATLVHYSTDYVFDGDNKDGYKEDDPKDPQSVYAKSKSMGEVEVIKNCKKFYIIRLSKLFGSPAISVNAKKSFVDTMLNLAKEKSELNVVDEELSSPTYSSDLARQTKKIIESKMPYGIYHVTNSGACTWYEFANEIFAIKGIDVKINSVPGSFYPRPAKRPMYSILLNTKLDKLRSWQEALKDYLK